MADLFIQACPACGTNNRIPYHKHGQEAKCGKCGARFTTSATISSSPVKVTDATFSKEVLEASLPVLVDFWAPWCGPCRMVAPVLEELAREFAGRVKIVKINTDENQHTASQYRIQSIPTLLFIKHGRIIEQVVGVQPKHELVNKLQQLL